MHYLYFVLVFFACMVCLFFTVVFSQLFIKHQERRLFDLIKMLSPKLFRNVISVRKKLIFEKKHHPHRFCFRRCSTLNRPYGLDHSRQSSAVIDGEKGIIYEAIIGLEVHAQIRTSSKLFSCAGTDYAARPNTQVAHFDLSLPGTLPVLNRAAVEIAVRTALALDCQRIARRSTFDRKHYFYGDMPNGYQITQQREPIACDGTIDFIVYDEYFDVINRLHATNHRAYLSRCRLKQIQLEQDSGKSLFDAQSRESLIDLNRAGVPLMEFVFEPDLRSSLEAACLVRELAARLDTIGACNCRMEEGALRVDANVSLRPVSNAADHNSSSPLGTRTEIKNLNSFRFLREAIDREIERQTAILRSGDLVVNETLGFDYRTKTIFVMRDKAIVQDYRFMPEPNLPPIILHDSDGDDSRAGIDIAEIRRTISFDTLSPSIRAELSQPEYGLTLREIFYLLLYPELRRLFLEVFRLSETKRGMDIFAFLHQLTSPPSLLDEPWQISIDIKRLNESTIITAPHLAELIDLLAVKRISLPTAFDVVKLYLTPATNDRRSPRTIIDQFNWWLVTDPTQIEEICREVTRQIPKVAKKFAKTGLRKPKSMLIQRAQIALGNRVNENELWPVFERILRTPKTENDDKRSSSSSSS